MPFGDRMTPCWFPPEARTLLLCLTLCLLPERRQIATSLADVHDNMTQEVASKGGDLFVNKQQGQRRLAGEADGEHSSRSWHPGRH